MCTPGTGGVLLLMVVVDICRFLSPGPQAKKGLCASRNFTRRLWGNMLEKQQPEHVGNKRGKKHEFCSASHRPVTWQTTPRQRHTRKQQRISLRAKDQIQ
ncbi:uncharacterized protein YALI1_C20592g [Yarrowia lipolytica]|uniref:Secreted protein n=1 Tax=Yarrowia lipolytica TaxID=4952 RepID=A0A1D8NB75_YARLL|nr:hypothetical protein YALI1_C20592g [Yarrowia lipolytica]